MAVQTVQFFLFGDTESDGFVDDLKDDEGHDRSESGNSGNAQNLNTDKLDTAHAVFCKDGIFGENTGQNCSEHTAGPVNTGSTDRVVNFKDPVDKFDDKDDSETADDTDGESAVVGNDIAAGGDTDQAGKCPIHGHRDIRFSITYPCKEEGNEC